MKSQFQSGVITQPGVKEVPVHKVITLEEPLYHVILLDDDDHSYDYVIEICMEIFGMSETDGYLKAVDVDTDKFVILLTTTKDEADHKRDLVHSKGVDWRMQGCKGSMTALVEQARG